MDISNFIFFGALVVMGLVVAFTILGDYIADRIVVRNALRHHTNPYVSPSPARR